jgi:hypothetical protein
MGGLIPIGQGADAEIKGLLNKTFSFTSLTTLQNLYATEQLFDPNHSLHRVAYRLRCFPKKKYTEPSRAKWFYFLQTTLPAASNSGVLTSDAIKHALDYAQNPAKGIARVIFEAVEVKTNPPVTHYLHPNNLPASVATNMVHGSTLHLLLICPAPLDSTLLATDPTTADPGEPAPPGPPLP